MTRYAKRKLKYALNENINLVPYVAWDRFITLTGAQAEWGLRYRIYYISCKAYPIWKITFVNHSLSSKDLHIQFYQGFVSWPLFILVEIRFRRNVCLYLHPNLVSSPIMGILEIFYFTPGSFRWIFCHGRIVSDQVHVIFHI